MLRTMRRHILIAMLAIVPALSIISCNPQVNKAKRDNDAPAADKANASRISQVDEDAPLENAPPPLAVNEPASTVPNIPMPVGLSAAKGGYAVGHAANKKSVGAKDQIQREEGNGTITEQDPGGEFNTEDYSRIYENEFVSATANPLSTFSIDVDAASYSNTRRYINEGSLPPRDAVRIEEFVNYFSYDYPQPKGGVPFSINTDVAICPWDKSHRLVHIGLQGRKIPMADLPPSNIVFLIDVSGSMDEPNKLPLLQSAFRLLVNELRDRDKVSIVVYAGAAGLVLPPTPGSDKKTILDAIDNLQAGGSTAGGAGIQLAYATALKNFNTTGNNRVILATDGDFNVGASSEGDLVRLIEEKRQTGIFLTVLGFGTGNLKDSHMEQLADKGNGNYAYIDNLNEARKVFVSELGATLLTIAKDVKIQVEFNPAEVQGYRLIGYENRMLHSEDFNDDKKDAGELGAGHSVTALYEIIPTGGPARLASIDPLKYQTTVFNASGSLNNELMTVKLRYKQPKDSTSMLIVGTIPAVVQGMEKASDNLKFASAVAEWGLLLRESKFKGTASFDDIIKRATEAKGADANGYRAEFISLVEKSKTMKR